MNMKHEDKAKKVTAVLDSFKEVELEHKWCTSETFTTESALNVVRNLAQRGFSGRAIASIFGMSDRTFFRRIASNPHLSAAVQEGKANYLKDLYNTAKALGVSGVDPQMTRFLIERAEREIERENSAKVEEESVVDVSSRPSGPITQDEIKAIVKDAYEKDPMLNEQTSDDTDK